MSSAENRPSTSPSAAAKPSSDAVPKRPSLIKPPPRPDKPADVPAASAPAATPAPAAPEAAAPVVTVPQPISPPSEPRQYRAIGLVRGTYEPSEEQFNRGNLITAEGTVVDSVLLGRVTSLVKKHIDLAAPHLWVVYPRTRQDEHTLEVDLHLQIVGVWEPKTLGLPGEEASEDGTDPEAVPDPQDNYFSIRGEVLKYEEDTASVVVKILQGAKQEGKGIKAFRLNVAGPLPSPKTVGYFWDLEVERQEKALVIQQATLVGIVPPKKRKGPGGKKGGGGRKPMGARRGSPAPSKGKPRVRPMAPVKSNPL